MHAGHRWSEQHLHRGTSINLCDELYNSVQNITIVDSAALSQDNLEGMDQTEDMIMDMVKILRCSCKKMQVGAIRY
jgi:hypothetical protein